MHLQLTSLCMYVRWNPGEKCYRIKDESKTFTVHPNAVLQAENRYWRGVGKGEGEEEERERERERARATECVCLAGRLRPYHFTL